MNPRDLHLHSSFRYLRVIRRSPSPFSTRRDSSYLSVLIVGVKPEMVQSLVSVGVLPNFERGLEWNSFFRDRFGAPLRLV